MDWKEALQSLPKDSFRITAINGILHAKGFRLKGSRESNVDESLFALVSFGDFEFPALELSHRVLKDREIEIPGNEATLQILTQTFKNLGFKVMRSDVARSKALDISAWQPGDKYYFNWSTSEEPRYHLTRLYTVLEAKQEGRDYPTLRVDQSTRLIDFMRTPNAYLFYFRKSLIEKLQAEVEDQVSDRQFWALGASWNGEDQTERFLEEGCWQNGHAPDQYSELVNKISEGDRIAVKSVYTRGSGPERIGCLKVKAIGTVVKNNRDGETIYVDWDSDFEVVEHRDFGGNLRSTVHKLKDRAQIERIFYMKSQAVNSVPVSGIGSPIKPLNQILFGPPGTGKTYHTINKAVEIADPAFYNQDAWESEVSRKRLHARYDDLVNEGRIAFCTFHQSFSYEDFVEGIKPLSDEGSLEYMIESGVLKSMANAASTKTIISEEQIRKTLNQATDQPNPLTTVNNRPKEFRIAGLSNNQIEIHLIPFDDKPRYINIKDVQIVLEGLETYNHLVYYIKAIASYIQSGVGVSDKIPHILIIDEINRGNVSQIFGELITLIEDDKRQGRPEALTVTLPYSKKPFSLPDNLYIIGTMNTADRSVEALDTALRRRFVFEELPAKPELLGEAGQASSLDLVAMLSAINERMILLKDKNHTIGHAFFINCRSLEDVQRAFAYKVLPLLEEFFYGEAHKIGQVLGEEFVVAEAGRTALKTIRGLDNYAAQWDQPKFRPVSAEEVMKFGVEVFAGIALP